MEPTSAGAAGTGIGALLGALYQRYKTDKKIDEIENKIDNLALELAKNYVPRSEISEALHDIKTSLRRLEDKIK
jgi:septation ring formation regulator EzrA